MAALARAGLRLQVNNVSAREDAQCLSCRGAEGEPGMMMIADELTAHDTGE